MRRYIISALAVISIAGVLAVAQEAIFGPPLPNNQFFHASDTSGRLRALFGIDENDDIVIDEDNIDVRFGNNIDVDGTATIDGTSTHTGAVTNSAATTHTGAVTNSSTTALNGDTTITGAEFHEAQGTNEASASNLSPAGDGTVYRVTGTTAINTMDTTGFQNGSAVELLFTTAGVQITHGATPSGLTAAFELGSNANISTRANEIYKFRLTQGASTVAWRRVQ